MRLLPLLALIPSLQAASPWTIDALMNLRTVHDPQITADGTTVAYVVRSVDRAANRYRSEIRIQPAGPGKATVIEGNGTESTPRFSPDGRQLAFVSRRDGGTQIYVVALPGGQAKPVTSSKTGIEFFRWLPDGKRLGYVSRVSPDADAARKKQAGDDPIVAGEAGPNNAITLVSLSTGEAQRVPVNRHVLTFDISPDGNTLVYAAQKSPRRRDTFHSDLYEYNLASGKESVLVEQPGQDLNPTYSRDGRLVAFYSQKGVLSYFGDREVGVVPSGGGRIRYVTEGAQADVFNGARKFWWSSDSRRLMFGAGKGTADYLMSVDPTTGRDVTTLSKVSDTSAFSVSDDGRRIVSIRPSGHASAEVAVNDAPITDLNPEARQYEEVRVETVRWHSKDGLEVEGVLRLPSNSRPGARLPLLTIIHGGPTGVATESFPVPRLYPTQLFLHEGFAVFEPNFRGSINYGPRFRTPTIQQQGFGDMDDVLTGIDMLVAKGIADPDRLGVMGWSYGGYLSSWMVGHTDRFKAASIGACSMDWVSHYGESVGQEDGPPEVVQEYFGGSPWTRFEAYQRHSPRFSLKNVKTPSLLLRGERDQDSMGEMHVALTELGVPNVFVTYPREPHGIGEPAHQRDLLERNLAWFKRWLPAPSRETARRPSSAAGR